MIDMLIEQIEKARYTGLVGTNHQVVSINIPRSTAQKIEQFIFNTFRVDVEIHMFTQRDTTYRYYVSCIKKVNKAILRDLQLFASGIEAAERSH